MLWDKENRMEYWFPKIPEIIPKPITKIIPITPNWSEDGSHMTIPEEEFKKIETASKEFSFPLFIRGSETSGKHDWKDTCFVEKFEDIRYHITALIEDAMLKDIGCNSIVLREFIKMDSGFSAFGRDMPVNPERRYFVKDGKVLCHHPYWIQDAIRHPSVENWKEILEEMNEETEGEIELLTSYSEIISKEFEGYWSIDFCRTKKGKWVCIDMALGEDSWHPECSNKLKKEIKNE